MTLREIEKAAILERMASLDNDKPRVAKSLGINLTTLYTKLNLYRMSDPHLFRQVGESRFEVSREGGRPCRSA